MPSNIQPRKAASKTIARPRESALDGEEGIAADTAGCGVVDARITADYAKAEPIKQ
jgi:hypothetical protein